MLNAWYKKSNGWEGPSIKSQVTSTRRFEVQDILRKRLYSLIFWSTVNYVNRESPLDDVRRFVVLELEETDEKC